MPKGMTVEGLDALRQRLNKMERNSAGVALDAAVKAGAEVVADEMSARAPRSSTAGGSRGIGHAADFIGSEIVNESFRGKISEAGIGVDKGHWYLRFAELGTRHHPARPFMRQSLSAMRGEAVGRLAAVLRREIERAMR